MSKGPSITGSVPASLDEVYEAFTPMLLSAVGSLARRGYGINPGEALDVIHDFYLEALPGLFEHFDPSKGKFSTYLYGSFLQFARPRIVRGIRWKAIIVPFDEAIDHPAPILDDYPPVELEASVLLAYKRLPKTLRATLDARLDQGQSERAIAKRFRVSRYVVRQRLAEALGRIAVAISHDETFPEDLRPLAIRLWRDQQPLMRVAADLGLSRQQARLQYGRLIHSLSAAAASLGNP